MESITSKLRAKLLLIAAVPHILLMVSQSLIAIVDTLIVAPIGIEAIAAVFCVEGRSSNSVATEDI